MTTEATAIIPPTCGQLGDDGDDDSIESVGRTVDDSWRHCVRVTQVFHRATDDTFWQACYRLSSDQETNELRDGGAKITRVYPHSVSHTIYTPNP